MTTDASESDGTDSEDPKGEMESTRVDCTAAFGVLGRRRRTAERIVITLTEHSYLPGGELTEGWFPVMLGGLRALAKEERGVHHGERSFASIGTGPALEAIGAVEVLRVTDLVLTDVHADVTRVAQANVLQNCPRLAPDHVESFTSDICKGLIDRQRKVDIIYENLPNLPSVEPDITSGSMSASFFGQNRLAEVPAPYAMHRLVLHYLFLRQASECLTDRGLVICCIGTRVPAPLIRRMFEECGYKPQVLHFDVVRQFEGAAVLAGYAQAEAQSGVQFRFYRYEEARAVVRALRRGGASLDRVLEDGDLKRHSLSATEGKRVLEDEGAVGHVGAVWLGRRSW